MNNQENEKLCEHIRNRINELKTIAKQYNSGATPESSAVNSAEDSASISVALKITEHEKQELAQLKANLIWLDSDDGGYCDTCRNDIPIARLHAVPSTRLCVNCAQ